MTKEKEKSPVLAAFLSFIIWGLGQIYAGKQVKKGVALIFLDFFLMFLLLSPLMIIILIIGLIVTPIIMWDAYKDAKEYNNEIQFKSKNKSETILSTNGEKILHTPQKVVNDIKQQLKGEEIGKTPPKNYDDSEKNNVKKKKLKFCTECGYKLDGSPKFCPECGNKLV
jgi:hypothetical protein